MTSTFHVCNFIHNTVNARRDLNIVLQYSYVIHRIKNVTLANINWNYNVFENEAATNTKYFKRIKVAPDFRIKL